MEIQEEGLRSLQMIMLDLAAWETAYADIIERSEMPEQAQKKRAAIALVKGKLQQHFPWPNEREILEWQAEMAANAAGNPPAATHG